MFFAPAFVTLSALVTFASALTGPKIILPTADKWWVAQSTNVLTWDCKNSQATQFGVYISNKDPKVLQGNLAIFAQLDNTVCSKEVTQLQVTQPAATGYTLLFTNIVNQTDVYSQSDEFEIKPLGSAYPQTSSVAPSGTGTAAGSSSSGGSSGGNNGASSHKSSLGYGLAAVGALVGLIAA
ncbi:hypothetical protein L218DRAFT_950517 [Marasmius fiardii PR-910]|nr:hypothetical protein L218DRAFT_950517 [Marasmius fiardii PR-910]